MPLTVRPRVPLGRTLDAFYETEEAFFDSARIVDWTLLRQEACDVHPYDEFAYVLEGVLVMESGGQSVRVEAGQVGMVPAGSIGRYWTPRYVRMISLGGPNPDKAPSTFFGYRSLDEASAALVVDPAVAPAAVHEAAPVLLGPAEIPGRRRGRRFGSGSMARAWSSLVLGEWELRSEEQSVVHPFDHFVFVLEGTLLATADGRTTAVGAGTMVHVTAGTSVRYTAPVFAKVLEVDGPNPSGAASEIGSVTATDG